MPFLASVIALLALAPSLGLRYVIPGTPAECARPGTPTEELNKAKAVFTGKVVGRKYVTDNQPGQGAPGERLVERLEIRC
jgi:hypothetical protein